MKSKVSVIIPTYKGESTLARAINSVLRQSYDNYEIIVVDDNSPGTPARKMTEEIIKGFNSEKIIYIKHEKNKNGAAARNTGISCAAGDYICFLDDDDVYLARRLEKSVEALENHLDCGAVFCSVIHLGDKWRGNIYKMDTQSLTPEGILLNEAALGSGSNLFIRTSLVKKINGFDPDFLRHQDLEFAIRLLSETDPFIISDFLVVKSYNSIDNQPDYTKLKRVKTQYNSKFEEVISRMPENEKRRYYHDCYLKLFGTALREGNSEHIKESLSLCRQYGFQYNVKRRIQVILALSRINQTRLYNRIMTIRNLYFHRTDNRVNILEISTPITQELKILFNGGTEKK